MRIIKSDNDFRTDYLVAERIVASDKCKNAELALCEKPRQPVVSEVLPYMTIEQGGYILLDFGVEFSGGVVITVPHNVKDAKLRITLGESVTEAMSTIGVNNATNDHSVRDAVVDIVGWQTFRFGYSGFRFVKIEAVNCDVNISGIQGAYDHRELEYKGEFSCSDELLNKIWEMGAYTVSLAMQEYLVDGIKRDRLVWAGDMHPEVCSILAAFGDHYVVKKTLDFARDTTPCDRYMNDYPSYNLWWIQVHHMWYMHTGDIDYLNQQRDYLFNILNNLLSHIDENGNHDIDNTFCDWSSKESECRNAGFSALLTMGLSCASELCRILDNDELGAKCDAVSLAVSKNLTDYSGNKQVAGLVALSGMTDAKDVCENVIKKDGVKGLSAFLGYYVLCALHKANDTETALDMIREYWGGMIEMGATTFWEEFDVEWMKNANRIDELHEDGKSDIHADNGEFCYENLRLSLCHGWASGPTAFLSRYILGVTPLEPGFKKVRVSPNLCGLEWVKGAYPTPYGSIKIECDKSGTKIIAPDGIEVVQ